MTAAHLYNLIDLSDYSNYLFEGIVHKLKTFFQVKKHYTHTHKLTVLIKYRFAYVQSGRNYYKVVFTTKVFDLFANYSYLLKFSCELS